MLRWMAGVVLGCMIGICVLTTCLVAQEDSTTRAADAQVLNVVLRSRAVAGSDGWIEVREKSEAWSGSQTAIIVCDMWDSHHCLNAVRRVKELAPRIDQLLKVARQQGVTIIHAPSSCMDAYVEHPARRRAQLVPKAKNLPEQIESWCYWKNPVEENADYPIDQSDGGED
ncbi:MAG: hypothetical protein KDB23_05400, partial [Planctomycetales bacterium]|nr:hypothetical protein [Planctomycetales bacterium]